MITDEKALEYQQVAGLVCMDIDILADTAEFPDMTLEDLRSSIRDLKKKKDEVIANKELRESRYNAILLLFTE